MYEVLVARVMYSRNHHLGLAVIDIKLTRLTGELGKASSCCCRPFTVVEMRVRSSASNRSGNQLSQNAEGRCINAKSL